MTRSTDLPAWALQSPVARLGTVDGTRPHLVPVVFCDVDGFLFVPIDGKPKSGKKLKRVANIERNPAVALLIDHYADDWSELRWIRIDGYAEIVDTDAKVRAALGAKYAQYEHLEMGATAIRIAVERMRSWSASGRS